MQQTEPSAGQAGVAGQLPSRMCSQCPEFRCLGEDVLDTLEGGRGNGSFIKADIVFGSQGEAFSLGRYYYRYIYLGKEEVTLYSFDENGKFVICVLCGNLARAVSEHNRVRDRFSEVVQKCSTLGDRERAEYFYDWVYDNVSYDQMLKNRTIYDAVMSGNAVCWGYVSACLTLCRSAGLICEPVCAGGHAWNRTWLDGEWGCCDITWDKSLGSTRWRFIAQKDMDTGSMHNNL